MIVQNNIKKKRFQKTRMKKLFKNFKKLIGPVSMVQVNQDPLTLTFIA